MMPTRLIDSSGVLLCFALRNGIDRLAAVRPMDEGTIARAIAGCHETYASQTVGKIIHFRRKPEDGNAPQSPCHCPKHDGFCDRVPAATKKKETADSMPTSSAENASTITLRACGTSGRAITGSAMTANTRSCCLRVGRWLRCIWMLAHNSRRSGADAEKHLDPDPEHLKGDGSARERYRMAQSITSDLIGRAKALKKFKRAQAVLTYAQAYLRITSREWDTSPGYSPAPMACWIYKPVNFARLPDDYLRTAIPTGGRAEDLCPRWEQFLSEIFEDKPEQNESRRFLPPASPGLRHHRVTTHHVFTILYGEEGRNGKDTLARYPQGRAGAAGGSRQQRPVRGPGQVPRWWRSYPASVRSAGQAPGLGQRDQAGR